MAGSSSAKTRGACHRAALCADPLALLPGHDEKREFSPSKPRKPRLHRIGAAVEFAQVCKAAHRQAVRVLFAGVVNGQPKRKVEGRLRK